MLNISINEHSSIRIEEDSVVYIDPYNITEESGDADIIFVTHSHYDHFSPDSINKLIKDDTVIVMPESMSEDYISSGIKCEALYVKPESAYEVYGLVFEAVRSYNLNKDFHPKKNDWVGYILNIDDKRVYICGDTDNTPEARKVNCDILMLPIGGTYTMNSGEAAELTNIIKPRTVIPTHYGTVVGRAQDAKEFIKLVGTDTVVVEKLHF